MKPCQKQHFERKKNSYKKQIVQIEKAIGSTTEQKLIEEQRKRIQCFQGLINQLNETLKDT